MIALNRRRVMGVSGGVDIIMSTETNPEMMAVVYGKGWCASPDYMTKQEAEAVTTLGSSFCMGNTSVTHFEEFVYFTGVTQLLTNSFRSASNLASIVFPTSLTYIRDYCINGTKIVSIDTKNVYYVGSQSLTLNSQLKDVVVGKAFQTVSTSALTANVNIETISVDADNPYFVTNGDYLKRLSDNFVILTTKTCDTIPEGVVGLSNNCIRGHTLTTLDLPSTLTDIAANTFYQAKITNLICRATTPPTCATNALSSLTVTNIYVPDASVSAYQSATGWSSYSAKIQGLSNLS